MISYYDAIKIIQDSSSMLSLGLEEVPLKNAINRICAKDIKAGLDIQPFDNSAMDGFAVRFDDIRQANTSNPIHLKKSGVIAAGTSGSTNIVTSGNCWHVMTGAPIPQGTDCIVPIEDVIIEDQKIILNKSAKLEQHIRRSGQDFKKGSDVIFNGELISNAHIMPLASLGIAKLCVYKKPKILFLSTGAEINDNLAEKLQDGQIYNSNKPYAISFLETCGANIESSKTIPDDPDSFIKTIKQSQKNGFDIIISSGAVSAGSFDFIKDSLLSLGAEILYHKIKLKPGKPNLLARLPDGTLYFGLPGNPIATAVGLRFFVVEALRALRKQKPEIPLYARAMNQFSKKQGMHMVLKSRFESWEDGSLGVDILDGQESFMISPFLKINSWLHVNENKETIKAGEVLEIYPFMPN